MKLPPRRVLRCIVQDAISDREEMDDATRRQQTSSCIDGYKALIDRLSDGSPALSQSDLLLLGDACRHARIWREGYAEAWQHTGDHAVIQRNRNNVDRITRTENALGITRHFIAGGADPEGMTTISVHDLLETMIPQAA